MAVPLGIFRHVGVEQVNRHRVAIHTQHVVLPRAHGHLPLFDLYGDVAFYRSQRAFRFPLLGLLALISRSIQVLAKVSVAVDQGHGNHRSSKIRSRTESISRQHPQTAAVGRHVWVQRDLHRKISDVWGLSAWFHMSHSFAYKSVSTA